MSKNPKDCKTTNCPYKKQDLDSSKGCTTKTNCPYKAHDRQRNQQAAAFADARTACDTANTNPENVCSNPDCPYAGARPAECTTKIRPKACASPVCRVKLQTKKKAIEEGMVCDHPNCPYNPDTYGK